MRTRWIRLLAAASALAVLPFLPAAAATGAPSRQAATAHRTAAHSAARSAARQAHLSAAQHTAAPPPAGNLEVTVPPVAFGPDDQLPRLLQAGHRYRGRVMALATPGVTGAVVSVSAENGTVSCSGQGPLTDGVVDRLDCTVTPDKAGVLGLVVTVVTDAGTHVVRYTHPVAAS